ncbi:hypothetical protein OKN36_16870 [Furfurilactobacillus sp. OKN36]
MPYNAAKIACGRLSKPVSPLMPGNDNAIQEIATIIIEVPKYGNKTFVDNPVVVFFQSRSLNKYPERTKKTGT